MLQSFPRGLVSPFKDHGGHCVFFNIYFHIKMYAFFSLGTILHYSYHQQNLYCLSSRQLVTVCFQLAGRMGTKQDGELGGNFS